MANENYLAEFLSGAREQLFEVEAELFSEDQLSQANLKSLLRFLHTVKGASALVQLTHINRFVHEVESHYVLFRSQKLAIPEDELQRTKKCLDGLRILFDVVEKDGDDKALENRARNLLSEFLPQAQARIRPSDLLPLRSSLQRLAETCQELLGTPEDARILLPCFVECFSALRMIQELKLQAAEPWLELVIQVVEHFSGSNLNMPDAVLSWCGGVSTSLEKALGSFKEGKPANAFDSVLETVEFIAHLEKLNRLKSELSLTFESRAFQARAEESEDDELESGEASDEDGAMHEAGRGVARIQELRVSVNKLTELGDLIGELVTAKTMLRSLDLDFDDNSNLARSYDYLSRVTTSLQDLSLSLRMVPLRPLFRKMYRIVSDTAERTGKKAELVLRGEEVEIDRLLVEKLMDPLIHMLRNSVDHGLEDPDGRKKAGKPVIGRIHLEAFSEGGDVKIVVRDDGRGLVKQKLIKRAVERGLVKENHAFQHDAEIFSLIFHPGFSTAEKVTEVSGRGVGMDIVKANVESLNGHITIRSKEGEGTALVLSIPLTMSIIRAMLVRMNGVKLCIPIDMIRESISQDLAPISIYKNRQRMLTFRNREIPIFALSDLFRFPMSPGSTAVYMVCGFRERLLALEVEELIGQIDAVVKPMPELLGRQKGIAGCTILGDGEVSLILEVNELQTLARHKGTNLESAV